MKFRMSLPESEYPAPAEVARSHQAVIDRIPGLPGTQEVGAVVDLPLSGPGRGTAMDIEDQPTEEGQPPPIFWFTSASPGYFEAMHIPLLAGRTFDRLDHETEYGTAIVSASIADRFWDGESPSVGGSGFPGHPTVG